jgi:hypothetical protein
MSTKTTPPSEKKGSMDNSVPYSPGPREEFASTTQPSAGGLDKIDGSNPETGTGIC